MRKVLPIIVLAVLLGLVARFLSMGPAPRVPGMQGDQLRVHFLNVGQGDCILLQTPDRRNVLVDAGGEDSADDVVGYLIRSGVDRIDLLVITHPHEDHVGGLPRVLEEFGVSQILDAGYPHGSPAYREALCSIEARKIDYRLAADWRTLYISKQVGFEVLWPPEDYSPSEEGLNDGSLVLRVRYGGVSLLLAGDIEAEAEARLLAAHLDLKSTVLKVAHHGSADGTSNEFLQLVQPEYAVVSVGMDNPYGHPAGAVLRRLRAVGAEVYRTDRHGTVVFLTDGEKVEVKSER